MKSERSKEKSAGLWVAILGATMGLALMFSLGATGRQAASSKGRAPAVETKAVAAASSVEINDIPVHHVPAHPELDEVQLD
ncbi:MAG: hypothetical protein ACM3SU_16220 [Acidobacteriota bacterium]